MVRKYEDVGSCSEAKERAESKTAYGRLPRMHGHGEVSKSARKDDQSGGSQEERTRGAETPAAIRMAAKGKPPNQIKSEFAL
jgi:hypothetical protein